MKGRSRPGLRVVVAEDDPDVNELIQEQLRRLGHDVVGVAYSGPEAEQLAENVRPDAVLMDLIMIDPESGREDRRAGETATQRIMAAAPCPVVWLTSFESNETTRRAAAAGAGGYLFKPAEDRDLDRSLVIAAARFADLQNLRLGNAELQLEVARRVAAEGLLRASEASFRSLFEESPSGIGLLDVEGRFLVTNAALVEMLGRKDEEIVGARLEDLVRPGGRERIDSLLKRLQEGGVAVVREDTRMLGSGDREIWIHLSMRPLADADPLAFRTLVLFENISERKEIEARLMLLSFHDALTGLYNRTFFEEEMARLELSRDFPLSVFVGDLDGLKSINDASGHAAGDTVLRHAAEVLRSAFRPSDVVARIGGDEFAALVPGANAEAAGGLLQRIRGLAERHRERGCGCGLRLSLGVSTVERGGSLVAALQQADALMYSEKFERRRGVSAP